jgi:hypothetical protein
MVNTSARAITFFAKLSQCKKLTKIRYTGNTHYQKEKENFCPMFSEKV